MKAAEPSAQTESLSLCICKQVLLSSPQHTHFTAEKKVLKGQWREY